MGLARTLGAYGLLAALVVGLIGGAIGFVSVPAGNETVVTYKGDPHEIAQPGTWYWFNPATTNTHRIDMRPQIMEMNQAGKGDDAINLQTNNEMRVPMDVAITYQVTDSEQFFQTWKSHGQARERLIRPVVRQRAYTEGGAMNTSELPTKDGRLKLTNAIYDGLEEEFENQPVEVLSVEIRGFHPPQSYMKAIQDKNVEAQRVQAKEQQAKQARVEAQGQADAARINAQGDADAERLRAEAEADANRMRADSLTDEVLIDNYVKGLSESDTVYIPIGDDGVPVLFTEDVRENETDGSGDETDSLAPVEVTP